MAGDAAVVFADVALEILDVVLFLGQRGGEVVVGGEAFFVLRIVVELLLGLAFALQLGHGLPRHGERAGLEILEFVHLLRQ